jgi:hypothetical protein|tara:strand:- start:17418 stop:17957 length:540 start_codon:yes stop_codon:yes gene_type:complete
MAIIPNSQKLHTVSSTVDTTDRGSAEFQSQREVYTMQDVIDTVSAGSSSTDLKNLTVTLSAAQLLSLNGGAEIQLIPAPGANKVIVVENVVRFLDFNSVAYNFAGALGQIVRLKQGANTGTNLPNNYLNAAADNLASGSGGLNPSVNTSVSIESTSGITVSQGDSPLKFFFLYREVSLT